MPKTDKILIISATGMLGSALTDRLQNACCDLSLTAWPDNIKNGCKLDITDRQAVEKVFQQAKPNIVFNCSAYTNVDGAETDFDTAMLINGTAVGHLAENCLKHNALLVHISTDYVFNGDSDKPYMPRDNPCPTTAYGRTKLAGEQAVLNSGCRHIIIRTSWLYGTNGKNFVDTIINLASSRDEIKVVSDQTGCPTYTFDLADCAIELAEADHTGIFHFCNQPACTWFDFAKEIVSQTRFNCKVLPCTTDQYPTPAKRPRYSVLDISETENALGRTIRNWQDTLKEYIICRK